MRLIHKKSKHFTELENNFSHHISHEIKCLKVVHGFIAITICNENTKPNLFISKHNNTSFKM